MAPTSGTASTDVTVGNYNLTKMEVPSELYPTKSCSGHSYTMEDAYGKSVQILLKQKAYFAPSGLDGKKHFGWAGNPQAAWEKLREALKWQKE